MFPEPMASRPGFRPVLMKDQGLIALAATVGRKQSNIQTIARLVKAGQALILGSRLVPS